MLIFKIKVLQMVTYETKTVTNVDLRKPKIMLVAVGIEPGPLC